MKSRFLFPEVERKLVEADQDFHYIVHNFYCGPRHGILAGLLRFGSIVSPKTRGCSNLVIKVMSSSLVPLKTRRAQEPTHVKYVEGQTSSRWCGSRIVVSDADCGAVGPGFESGEGMDVCKCIVPSLHAGTLNSCRAARPLVRLVEGQSDGKPLLKIGVESSKIVLSPAWCSKLRLTTGKSKEESKRKDSKKSSEKSDSAMSGYPPGPGYGSYDPQPPPYGYPPQQPYYPPPPQPGFPPPTVSQPMGGGYYPGQPVQPPPQTIIVQERRDDDCMKDCAICALCTALCCFCCSD
ncbi:hypothetical protein TNCV_1463711 [Trichonephila clavipes]|nr:hypothetical protein TNCV_1463711 [Trichonephila clavipes]